MKVIGIIGGGQLGMFLALAAYQMGYDTAIYDSNADCSAKGVATYFYHGEFDDLNKLEEFAKKCDLITYEFENINSGIINELSLKYPIVQKAHPLILSSSRINEKRMAEELKINQAKYQLVKTKNDLKTINIEYPYLLKSNSMGYDGKNQYTINKEIDLKKVDFSNNTSYLAEKKIAFDYEISIIGVQSITGEMAIYPPFHNIHHHGILNITSITKNIPLEVVDMANDALKKIMKTHKIYGLLCCEFFVKDNQIYFNEMAARPHNSGHITMDTHYYSQYENHLRALLGLSLGSCGIKCKAFMVNVLGQDENNLQDTLLDIGFSMKYYDYHKSPRLDRKIGHIIDYNLENLTYFKNKWR